MYDYTHGPLDNENRWIFFRIENRILRTGLVYLVAEYLAWLCRFSYNLCAQRPMVTSDRHVFEKQASLNINYIICIALVSWNLKHMLRTPNFVERGPTSACRADGTALSSGHAQLRQTVYS